MSNNHYFVHYYCYYLYHFFYHITYRDQGEDSGASGAEGRVLATFLNEMDGVDAARVDGVIVVGATNRCGGT